MSLFTDPDLDPIVTDRRTASQYVRDTLRDAILRGNLTIGTRLVQAEIARELSVSTTPVREALRALATEGLIGLDPHRGAVVRALNTDEVRDIHLLRRILEPEVMRRAVENITPSQLMEAEALQERLRVETDPGRWSDLNRGFHRVFLEAAGSARLAQMVGSLHDAYAAYIVTMMVHSKHTMEAATAEHDAILEAVRAGDAAAATRSVLQHMRMTVDHAEQVERAGAEGDGSR